MFTVHVDVSYIPHHRHALVDILEFIAFIVNPHPVIKYAPTPINYGTLFCI